jgi:hypothetical protein
MPEYKWDLDLASKKLELPHFPQLICKFLYDQMHPNAQVPSSNVSIDACPVFEGKISVFFNATAYFYAPSDISGLCNMQQEYICATPSWQNGPPRNDCVFINSNPELHGIRGLEVAHVFLFFSFKHQHIYYPCALVQWFSLIGDKPDDETGLWKFKPDVQEDRRPHLAIIHLDSIYCAAHLIPVYGTSDFVSRSYTMHDTLDKFKTFYVNKFVDHHAFKIAS